MNNKVAICISGSPREYTKCYPSFEQHILFPLKKLNYDCDIFIVTWKFVIPPLIKKPKQIKEPNVNINELISLYKPISCSYYPYTKETKNNLYTLSKFKNFQNGCRCQSKSFFCNKCAGTSIHNHLAMFYNIWKVNQLKLTHEERLSFKYKYVIRNRFDNLFLESLTQSILDLVKNKTIVIPRFYQNIDQFAVGTSTDMDIYSNIFFRMLYYVLLSIDKHPRLSLNRIIPRYMMREYFSNNNIKISEPILRRIIYYKKRLLKKLQKHRPKFDWV